MPVDCSLSHHTFMYSYVDFDGGRILSDAENAKFVSGVPGEEMDALLSKYCGKTVEGMRVLADFMSSV